MPAGLPKDTVPLEATIHVALAAVMEAHGAVMWRLDEKAAPLSTAASGEALVVAVMAAAVGLGKRTRSITGGAPKPPCLLKAAKAGDNYAGGAARS